ncbi:MAG: winged helix-turn-helix transcriptional regulator [Ignisphaera sp.]
MIRALPSLLLIALFVLFIAGTSTSVTGVASLKPLTHIYIDSNGIAHVRIEMSLSIGVNTVVLPVAPVIETITVVLGGQELPFLYDDKSNTLYIVSTVNASCVVDYVANVSIKDNVFSLSLSREYVYRLYLAPNIILLTVPNNISYYGYVNNSILYIEFSDEPTINYIVKEPTQSQQFTTPATAPKTFQPLPHIVFIIIGVALGAAALFILYLYMSRARSRGERELELLSDIDLAILKSLEKRGGSALQSELQKDVPVPRTTLWRHVKKLEKLGYVRIEKVGLQNKVVLVKKPRSSS